jgi:hypothetical protein
VPDDDDDDDDVSKDCSAFVCRLSPRRVMGNAETTLLGLLDHEHKGNTTFEAYAAVYLTQHNILEDVNLQQHCCKDLKIMLYPSCFPSAEV